MTRLTGHAGRAGETAGGDPQRHQASDLVMAWARDRDNGRLRYVLELGSDERGAKCNCVCISCGQPLQAINAATAVFEIRPHFRHPAGSQKDACLVLTARAALLDVFKPGDTIVLPKLRRTGRVEGLSGQFHDAWVELPRETVKIANVDFRDGLKATLTLDDGRCVLVQIVGSASPREDGALVPTIDIVVDDPAIAAIPLEELRQRLEPLLEEGCWRGHWNDAQLTRQAEEAAREIAINALDWDELGDLVNVPAGARRETLLHRVVKEILAEHRRIRLPSYAVRAEREVDDGSIRRTAIVEEKSVHLEAVVLERRLGDIVPDVIATALDGSTLLVEVTVTNRITAERLERIRSGGYAALEIDIGRMGGRVTRDELVRLVIDEAAGKRWLHLPEAEKIHAELLQQIDADISAEKERRKRHEALVSNDADSWADDYLEAIERHAEVRLWPATEKADDGTLEYYLSEAEEAAEGLAAHGYPEAFDRELYRDEHNIIERILSIKHDRGIGYDLNSGWKVINAIMQDGPARRRWHTLYLIAIRVYAPKLTKEQKERIATWRADVWDSLIAGELLFVRSTRYDRLLALLFPEMKALLERPLVPSGRRSGWDR